MANLAEMQFHDLSELSTTNSGQQIGIHFSLDLQGEGFVPSVWANLESQLNCSDINCTLLPHLVESGYKFQSTGGVSGSFSTGAIDVLLSLNANAFLIQRAGWQPNREALSRHDPRGDPETGAGGGGSNTTEPEDMVGTLENHERIRIWLEPEDMVGT